MKTVSQETLRFRLALRSLREQASSSRKTVKKLARQGDYVEALRLDESTTGLFWAINHIDHWLKYGKEQKL